VQRARAAAFARSGSLEPVCRLFPLEGAEVQAMHEVGVTACAGFQGQIFQHMRTGRESLLENARPEVREDGAEVVGVAELHPAAVVPVGSRGHGAELNAMGMVAGILP